MGPRCSSAETQVCHRSYIIAANIPPENSLYSSIDAFLDIENDIVNFIEEDMKCALVGDFNATTAALEDFSEPDETFLNGMDVNVEDGLFIYHIAMTAKFYLVIIFP